MSWRVLGIGIQIKLSFWIVSALYGWLILKIEQDARGQELETSEWLIRILIWVSCTLVSVLVHELGHVLVGRVFGHAGNIVLAGMGGQAAGKYESLHPWQRMLVAAAGPCAGFLFLGMQFVLDFSQWNMLMDWLDWEKWKVRWYLIDLITGNPLFRINHGYYRITMQFLMLMNLFWNVLNLLPIMPMDGGMILREICIMVFRAHGLIIAYSISILLAGLGLLYGLMNFFMNRNTNTAAQILDGVWILTFGMIAFQNFMGLSQEILKHRSNQYKERYDD